MQKAIRAASAGFHRLLKRAGQTLCFAQKRLAAFAAKAFGRLPGSGAKIRSAAARLAAQAAAGAPGATIRRMTAFSARFVRRADGVRKVFGNFVKNRITGGGGGPGAKTGGGPGAKTGRKPEPGVAGLWEDEAAFLEAIRAGQKIAQTAAQKKSGGRRFVTFSPFPVHGLEEAAGIKRSWIPYATFAGGLFGFLLGLLFTWWTSAESWPLIVGGKPLWSLPAFIPVIFELTILFAALASLAAWLFACGLPRKTAPPPLDPALTSHKFAVFIPLKPGESLDDVKEAILSLNPQEIREVKPS